MSTPIETNTEELREILNQVNNLPDRSGGSGGVDLPRLENPGEEEDLLYGKQLIGADRIKVTGSLEMIPLDNTTFSLQTTNVEETEDSYGKYIQITFENLPSRLAYEKGGSVRVKAKASNFGDASESDVVSGKTFTSKDGLTKPGSMPLITDTTGNMVIPPINTLKHVMAGNNVIRNVVEMPERVAFEANSRFAIDTLFKQLPNLESNLKAENIKKDVSIFDIVGTYEGSGGGDSGGSSGGLPSGISKLATGTITPSSDISSVQTITHGLGVMPDFIMTFADTGDIVIGDNSDFAGYFLRASSVAIKMKYKSNTYPYLSEQGYVTTDGTIRVALSYMHQSSITSDIFMLMASPSYKLKSGVTYHWVACAFE